MKSQTFSFPAFIALMLLFIIAIFPGNTEAAFSNAKQPINKIVNKIFEAEYTYVRVFKDGIWWIYVYDGSTLIAMYPEE